MATRKTRKLMRLVSKKQRYLKTYGSRIAKGDKSVPTYAQWAVASETERGLMQAGVGQKQIRRLKKR